ncbi:Pentatricopeptide repeat-containing protein At1g09900, partial [Durusdinium trenchii]
MSRELARSLGVLGHQSAWRQALQAFQEFQQLQQREPAGVAYNALLVCLARGRQLSRALKGLWQFREQRVLVDLEAYGGLISACDKRWQEAFAFLEEAQEQRLLDTALFKQALSCCNDWQQALDLLARMDRWQLPRTQPLFGALLSCFRKGPWQQAVHVLEDAWTSMCPPNAMMSNAALRSCAFGEAWEAALQLLAAMDLPDAEPPDSLSWAASMDACGRASEWLRVLQLLDDVFEGHEEPDKIIYRAAIHSLSSSQWRWSLQLYEEMPFQDPTPLEAVVLSLLEAQSWRQALALSEETRISGRSYAQLLCTAELHGSGPLGVEWLGINGGFSEDYVDHLGRRWHHTKEKWTPTGWGGYVAFKPRDYTNTAYLNGNQSLGRMRCRNWPAEYEPDYDALLQHYSREADAPNQTFRANLQDASAKVSYYTVKYQFCEKNRNGGAKMNIMINGKLVKRDFTTSCHHTITDIYHFKCIPTQSGMIEVSIQGDPTAKKPQARFSTLEFEKSLDGCGECELSCGVNGFCSSSSHYENPYSCGDRGSEFLHNEFDPEKLRSNASCACGSGVQGDFCELGVCAKTSCNEPFGGVCLNGTCACLSGYAGRSCERPPETDQFGCYSQEEVYGPLTVSTICLPELIAGPARHGHLFRGPSPMQGVSDRTK